MSESIEQVSWFSRIKEAFVGLVFGFGLFVASFVVLFWNEGRAVKTARSLEEGAKAVISVGADRVDPANERRLVHVTGAVAARGAPSDPTFGVASAAVRLRRKVAMYVWKESAQTKTEKQVGGGEVKRTVYSYAKAWSDGPVDSRAFHDPGHDNPAAFPYETREWTAKTVTLGAFSLSDSLIRQMDDFQPLAAQAVPASLSAKLKLADGSFYQGADPANPQVGDVRVSFLTVAPQTVSVVSQQLGSAFQPYATKAGRDIDMLVLGARGAPEMFASALASNRVLTWVLRGAGFFMMFLGLFLLLRPLDVLADVIPFLGSLVTAGTGLAAFVLATALSLVTIAAAWIAYRPLVGGALLVAGVVVFAKGVTGRVALPADAKPKTA